MMLGSRIASTSKNILIKSVITTTNQNIILTSNSNVRSFCNCSILKGTPGLEPRDYNVKKQKPHLKKNPRPLSQTLPQTTLFRSLNKVLPLSNRPTIINENTAREIVRGWGIDKMKDVVVIDAYAGPGGITKALLELKNVKRVIAIEEAFRYLPHLRALQEIPENVGRLEVIPTDPFIWETYANIEKAGFLADVPKVSWESGVHPNLFLCAQLPNNRHGEQLFFQFLSTSAGKMWLHQYGRFEMGFIGHEPFWKKLEAAPNTSGHHKLAVLVQAIASIQRVPNMSGLLPPELHFHMAKKDSALFTPVKVSLHEVPRVKNFEALEFVARHMFIGKAQPWPKAVTALAAGAGNLIPKMIERGLPIAPIKVNQLEMHHWLIIADVFDAWPFKPATMFDDLAFNGE